VVVIVGVGLVGVLVGVMLGGGGGGDVVAVATWWPR
jgi:hypothetical protein